MNAWAAIPIILCFHMGHAPLCTAHSPTVIHFRNFENPETIQYRTSILMPHLIIHQMEEWNKIKIGRGRNKKEVFRSESKTSRT